MIIIIMGIMITAIMLMIRNQLVYKERNNVLKKIHKLCEEDIIKGVKWKCRYIEYEKITYEEMLYKIWIPVKSFYKDHQCLKQEGEDNDKL